MSVTIERVETPVARWAEIEPLMRALHEFHLPLTGVPLLVDWARVQREHIGEQREGLVLLAREGGAAIGLANGWIARKPGIFDEQYARLDGIYVARETRSRGVGQALLAEFEAWAREGGVSEVRLGVVASNHLGRRFWEAAGFAPASIAMKKHLDEAT
jgi:GNAT superfamily N-acetyltransferase